MVVEWTRKVQLLFIVLFILSLWVVWFAHNEIINNEANRDAPPQLIITFDTEYPYGMSLYPLVEEPASLSEADLVELTTQNEWKSGIDRILELGDEYDVSFQFNVLGKTAESYSDIIESISSRSKLLSSVDSNESPRTGHAISCHTYSHPNMSELSYEAQLLELRLCKSIVEDIIGKEVVGNRFPYTRWNKDSFRALEQAGYEWDTSVWINQDATEQSSADTSVRDTNQYAATKYDIDEFELSFGDDWSYYVYEEKEEGFFDLVLDCAKDRDRTIVILHPWVLAKHDRLDEFEAFLVKAKNQGYEFTTLDALYKEAS